MTNAVIILAAGRGSRLGLETNKVLLPFRGKPLLYHSVKTFAKMQEFKTLVLVVRPNEEKEIKETVSEFMGSIDFVFCSGGETRQDSVFSGLKALSKSNPKKVLIHDGARPFVSESVILRVLDSIKPGLAVTPGVQVVDSLRDVDAAGNVRGIIDRSSVYKVQTPQGFMYKEIYLRHQTLPKSEKVTDDAQLFQEQILIEGDSKNIKITTRGDYEMYNTSRIMVGQGYDVHRMAEGRDLFLGGVKIPSDKGLLGHSDADVLVHAIMDAILGACGLGDIGEHFPDTDNAYKDISSIDLLRRVKVMLESKGIRVTHIDATVLAEVPKLSPYKQNMKENIASALGMSKEQVNIKATTNEKLGFVGRTEGIAAMAIATASFNL